MNPDSEPLIHLASRSPRRRELLDQIGVSWATVDQGVDESLGAGESPEVFVVRLALEKARAGHEALSAGVVNVLGADTVVVLDGEVMGKPADEGEARAMLAQLSGRSHRVLTGVALVDGEREATRLSVNNVVMRDIAREEMRRYWASGEPQDKAGAYAIQGRGAVFVTHLDGNYSGVMGLPLFETADLLDEFGLDYQTAWQTR
jgi:septum formation protein